MSIGAAAVSADPIAGRGSPAANGSSNAKGPPKNRTIVANSDAVAQPEPR